MPLAKPKGKQRRSMLQANARLNLWEGSVRSGKTVASSLRWLQYVANDGPAGDLLMVGKTERTLKRNILDQMQGMMGSRDFHHNKGSGELFLYGRRIYLAGANDERAEEKVRGLTLAGLYGDEVTLWPESMFKMCLSRLSVAGAKLFGTTNADSPYHWLKKDVLDRRADLDLRSWHFALDDNPNLDPEFVAQIKREYVGLWHKRFILGLWVMAEGAIYEMFDEDRHVMKDGRKLPKMREVWVGCDYGSKNATVFLLMGFGVDNRLYVIDEWYHYGRESGQKSPSQYSKHYRDWIKGHREAETAYVPAWIFVDPSAQAFIIQLYEDGVDAAFAHNDVKGGIGFVASLLATGLLRIHPRCRNLIENIPNYVWDDKAAERGEEKPIKKDDDPVDALRYGAYSMRHLWSGILTGAHDERKEAA